MSCADIRDMHYHCELARSVSATLWGVIAGEGVAKGDRASTSFLDGMPAALRESTVSFIIATSNDFRCPKNLREGVRVLAVSRGPSRRRRERNFSASHSSSWKTPGQNSHRG
jgi:hypothetical protein